MGTEQRGSHRLMMIVLGAGVGVFGMLQSLVIPALPTVQEELHTSQHTVTWVLTAYLLSASVFTPIMGRLGDAVGKRRVFIFSVGCLTVGSTLGALATAVPLMLVGRVIAGMGGGLLPLAFGIARDQLPHERVSGALSTLSALAGIGVGVGLVLSGPIVEGLGYTWLFWAPAIVAALIALAALVVVPESRVRMPGRVGWAAPVLLSGWLVALLLGVSKAPEWGWLSGRVIGLMILAVVLAILWVRVELAADVPLIDMRMMRRPAVWTSNLVVLLLGLGMYATFAFVPEFLQSSPEHGYGFGVGITESGLLMLPIAVTMSVGGASAGAMLRRFNAKRLLIVSNTVAIVPYLMFALAHDHKWQLVVAGALLGAALGLVIAVIPNVLVRAVPPEQTGVAMGMNANIRTIGGAIGAALMSTIVTSSAGADGIPTEAGYTRGFAMLAIGSVIGLLACFLVPSARRPTRALRPDTEGTPLEFSELALTPGSPADNHRADSCAS